eukprot:1154562-Pelagomonas_calceolata.AAC.8
MPLHTCCNCDQLGALTLDTVLLAHVAMSSSGLDGFGFLASSLAAQEGELSVPKLGGCTVRQDANQPSTCYTFLA